MTVEFALNDKQPDCGVNTPVRCVEGGFWGFEDRHTWGQGRAWLAGQRRSSFRTLPRLQTGCRHSQSMPRELDLCVTAGVPIVACWLRRGEPVRRSTGRLIVSCGSAVRQARVRGPDAEGHGAGEPAGGAGAVLVVAVAPPVLPVQPGRDGRRRQVFARDTLRMSYPQQRLFGLSSDEAQNDSSSLINEVPTTSKLFEGRHQCCSGSEQGHHEESQSMRRNASTLYRFRAHGALGYRLYWKCPCWVQVLRCAVAELARCSVPPAGDERERLPVRRGLPGPRAPQRPHRPQVPYMRLRPQQALRPHID